MFLVVGMYVGVVCVFVYVGSDKGERQRVMIDDEDERVSVDI